jgi:hypothetical protein
LRGTLETGEWTRQQAVDVWMARNYLA